MYVSMNPKGETGKVIHISQNDTNREVEFIPYDQNGLTPLTDGQLTAMINSIKGNTVSFNQLVQNGNFADTSIWNLVRTASLSVSNNIGTISVETFNNSFIAQGFPVEFSISGHKYFVSFDFMSSNATSRDIALLYLSATWSGLVIRNDNYVANSWKHYADFFVSTGNSVKEIRFMAPLDNSYTNNFKNIMLFDLTLMGIDNLTSTAEVEAWLSSHIGDLSYYDYTPGTLIPFTGTGLKTVGFNQWDEEWELGTYSISTGNKTSSSENIRSKNKIRIFPNIVYYAQFSSGAMNGIYFYDANETYLGSSYAIGKNTAGTFTSPSNAYYLTFQMNSAYGTTYNNNICINISDADKNGTYEPYTSNTLSLPISTYFPTGMKSAGSVYDELSDKAYTRVESVDLGTLTWTYAGGTYHRFYAILTGSKAVQSTDKANCICARYVTRARNGVDSVDNYDKSISISTNESNVTYINITDTSYSDATAFKNSLSNVYLYYEKATPTETDISLDLTYPIWNDGTEQILPVNESTPTTTPIKANITYPDRTEDTEFLYKQTSFEWIYKSWAFVCKNITQALSVVGNALKGTIPSTMTSESGKFPLKVKMTDNDGVCFSEKIDLFVERKP